jgi:hypothetical protein
LSFFKDESRDFILRRSNYSWLDPPLPAASA